MKILIMGLPGSGKTYLAERLQPLIDAAWYNADVVRNMANDWDFSSEGRIRQSMRMKTFADFEKSNNRYVICDFVCPTAETRMNFNLTETLTSALKEPSCMLPSHVPKYLIIDLSFLI